MTNFPFFASGGLFSFSSEKGIFRAPARVTFGRSPKSDQKVCLKPKVSRLPARSPSPGVSRGKFKLWPTATPLPTNGGRGDTGRGRVPSEARWRAVGRDAATTGGHTATGGEHRTPNRRAGYPTTERDAAATFPPVKYRAAAARARERPPQATAQARPAVGGGDDGGLNSAARMGGAAAGHRTKRNQMAAQGGTGRATTLLTCDYQKPADCQKKGRLNRPRDTIFPPALRSNRRRTA